MAIRHLLLAALASSALSAHAGPSIYASTGSGTVLLASTSSGQVQTFMPHAVEGFFTFQAPTAILADLNQSTAGGAITPTGAGLVAQMPQLGASTDPGTGEAPTVLLPLATDANAVPEPATGSLMLAGLAGVGFMARRRRPS